MDNFKAQVAALLLPGTYPLQVRRILSKPTHMAMVFLTERHAWKLRRPLRRGRMDFRTREARERDALSEARLDAHFAPGVCLGIVRLQRALVAPSGWILRHPTDPKATHGEPIVCMRRLPASGMLDHLVKTRRVHPDQIKRCMQVLAQRLNTRHHYDISGQTLIEHHRRSGHELLASLRCPIYQQPARQLDELAELLQACIDRHQAALADRASAGCIRDGHGDLRPEHVCLDGAWATRHGPAFIDALEFSDELRMLDPLQEAAGLAIECEFIGSPEVHTQIRMAWLSLDHSASKGLWELHSAEHALMRALHALWHLDTPRTPEDHRRWLDRGQTWLRLAQQQLLHSLAMH